MDGRSTYINLVCECGNSKRMGQYHGCDRCVQFERERAILCKRKSHKVVQTHVSLIRSGRDGVGAMSVYRIGAEVSV